MLPTTPTQSTRYGGVPGETGPPEIRLAARESDGSNHGSVAIIAPATTASRIATRRAFGPNNFSHDHPSPSEIEIPTAMFTTVLSSAEPADATGETPARAAIALIDMICHTFPGTYLPRLDTLQMRADSMNVSARACVETHASSIRRHVWISITYDSNTTTAEPTIASQFGLISSG